MGINVRLVRFLVNPDVLSSALKALTVMRLSSREKNEVQVLGGAFKSCHDLPATAQILSVPLANPFGSVGNAPDASTGKGPFSVETP